MLWKNVSKNWRDGMLENNKKRCTGCGACVWKCPKQCITWNIEELGFRYPVIDMSECVNCGVCENVCPIEDRKGAHV